MPMKKVIWTENEVSTLIELCKKHKTITFISKRIPTHTKTEIRTKCKSLGLEYKYEKVQWTESELTSFKKDWLDDSVSTSTLLRRYDRTLISLQKMATRLQLGPRPYDDSYLTVRDIMKEMNVSKDRVRSWIRNGLKCHYSKTSPKRYLIDQNDLLEFLENHQDLFDASKISDYLFYYTPKWLSKKKAEDSAQNLSKKIHHTEYTESELKRIDFLFKMGKSNEEIAKRVDRTPAAIERVLSTQLCLSRKQYNPYEIDIIKNNIEDHTIDEIAAMLPLRKKSGIIAKCEQLGLKYHSKRKKNE